MYRPHTGTSEKCIACYPRIEGKDKELTPDGSPIETRCMSACVGKIRLQGLVKIDEDGGWAADASNPLYYLIRGNGSCPRNAIYKRPEDGIVLVDQSRCRGYRKCVEGCPYKKAMYRPSTRTTEKCIGCFPRIEGKDKDVSPTGAPAETRCMSACVGKIRLQGLVKIDENGTWANDPKNPLYFLIRERQVALLGGASAGPIHHLFVRIPVAWGHVPAMQSTKDPKTASS